MEFFISQLMKLKYAKLPILLIDGVGYQLMTINFTDRSVATLRPPHKLKSISSLFPLTNQYALLLKK